MTRPSGSTTSPSRTRWGACVSRNAAWSFPGTKHTSCESGFVATGSPNRSASARVEAPAEVPAAVALADVADVVARRDQVDAEGVRATQERAELDVLVAPRAR